MTMIKYGDDTDCCLADQFIEALGVELPPHLFEGYSSGCNKLKDSHFDNDHDL